MCGRFALDYPHSLLSGWYKTKTMPELFPRYNIAPTTIILAIRDGIHGREGALMRWGFIPKWSIELKNLPLHNNARAETISTIPTFKNAFKSQRCIVPAMGFYEWKILSDGKHKQPYFITSSTGSPLSFAGVWERTTINDVMIESCSIITIESNKFMRSIHDRMPVILSPETFDTWLKPTELPLEILQFFLKPCDSDLLQAWPISTEVNRTVNQGKELIQPTIY